MSQETNFKQVLASDDDWTAKKVFNLHTYPTLMVCLILTEETIKMRGVAPVFLTWLFAVIITLVWKLVMAKVQPILDEKV